MNQDGAKQITPKRVGIYGGSFDPPHLVHFALAQAAVEQYALDELLVVPTGHAWHKSRVLTAASHRLAMAKMTFEDLPQARVDEREILRNGPSFTFDTLQELRAENPDAEWSLLMGEDQFSTFTQWHRYQDILKIATLLVALRADSMPRNSQKDIRNQGKINYSVISMPASPISATSIRQLAAKEQPINHLVKPAVARYIAENRLYSFT